MILLCAHQDTVTAPPALEMFHAGADGYYRGLLDNMLGVIAVHSAILRNGSLYSLVKSQQLSVYHTMHEEFLHVDCQHSLPKADFALVVDVVSGEKYLGLQAAIENMTIPEDYFGNFFQEEGYRVTTKAFTGEAEDQDEAWMWKDAGVPTCSILLPIDSPGGNWHRSDATCAVSRVDAFIDVLTRTICFLSEEYGGRVCQK